MYSRTQPASLLVTALLICIFIVLLFGWVLLRDAGATCPDPSAQIVTLTVTAFSAFVMVILLALFSSLTVYEDHNSIRIKYGIGLIGKSIPFERIQSCGAVTNPWYWGWGLRKIPGGRLYNISGLKAVELTLKDGGKIRIGTNEPEVLAGIINNRIGTQR